MAAVKQDGEALQFAAAALRGDKELVLAAVKQNGRALAHADEALQGDAEVVLAAVEGTEEALVYAAPALRGSKIFLLEALERNGWALRYAPAALQGDQTFLLEALERDASATRDALDVAVEERDAASAELRDLVDAQAKLLETNGSLRDALEVELATKATLRQTLDAENHDRDATRDAALRAADAAARSLVDAKVGTLEASIVALELRQAELLLLVKAKEEDLERVRADRGRDCEDRDRPRGTRLVRRHLTLRASSNAVQGDGAPGV